MLKNCFPSPLDKTDKAKLNTQALDTIKQLLGSMYVFSKHNVEHYKRLPSILKIISWEIKLYLTYYKIPFSNVKPQIKNLLKLRQWSKEGIALPISQRLLLVIPHAALH
jgi:hypothetical protein